jgi:hypothetical protein
MMQGDDILANRQRAEKSVASLNSHESSANLALWVIAEQLFEIRSALNITHELLAIPVNRDRKEVNVFVNGGSIEARGKDG